VNGRLLIGGGLFTNEQLSFGELVTENPLFRVSNVRSVSYGTSDEPIDEEFVVVFGMKGMVRTLSKNDLGWRKTRIQIETFFRETIPPKIPLIIVDDFSLEQARYLQKSLLKFFSNEFSLKLYLLREYLRGKTYPNTVQPFSLPADSYSKFRVNQVDKLVDIFFHGNASSADRLKITAKLKKKYPQANNHLVVTYGGVKNTSDRLSRDDFLNLMARSNFCLNFSGSGYDCYRYHEIASVGSVIVTPDYPHVIRNDYKDMVSCLKYRNFRDLTNKLERLRGSDASLEDMIRYSIDNFERYHTSEIRASEFMNFVVDAVRN